jgi:hypothetical protein
VVWLTEFALMPKISNAGGQDYYPTCYSFAGGEVADGQVYAK